MMQIEKVKITCACNGFTLKCSGVDLDPWFKRPRINSKIENIVGQVLNALRYSHLGWESEWTIQADPIATMGSPANEVVIEAVRGGCVLDIAWDGDDQKWIAETPEELAKRILSAFNYRAVVLEKSRCCTC